MIEWFEAQMFKVKLANHGAVDVKVEFPAFYRVIT
jgi:hypothetical protein